MTAPSNAERTALLLEAADRTDEDILQLVFRTGLKPTLDVIVREVFLDLAPALEGEPEPVLQYDLQLAEVAVSHHVRLGAAAATVAEGPSPDAALRVRHSLTDFLRLFRAALGPGAAGGMGGALDVLLGADLVPSRWRQQLGGPGGPDGDLCGLAARFGTDKWGVHWYTRHYDRHFRHLRERPMRLLEIGIGGYGDTGQGGASLEMWKRYFRRGLIHGVDREVKQGMESQRVRVFQGDQGDERFLAGLAERIGPLDLVIDDGSHVSKDVITSFRCLFPHLADGGLYAVEDLQTSYWPGFGGSSSDTASLETSIGFLKTLIDGLNHQEHVPAGSRQASYTDRHVVALHLYHNLAVIEKGDNSEASGWSIPERIKLHGFAERGPGHPRNGRRPGVAVAASPAAAAVQHHVSVGDGAPAAEEA